MIEYKGAMSEIQDEINKLQLLADEEAKKALQECGKVYKNKVSATSGGTEKFMGIGAGARSSVKKSKMGTGYYLVVKGSKQYAPLWHLANNGFVHVGNTLVPGNHFVDKAELLANGEVEKIIDAAVERIAK